MANIISYGCNSSAGFGVNNFWNGIINGKDHSQPIDPKDWPVKPSPIPFACLMRDRPKGLPIKRHLVNQLLMAWEELQATLPKDLTSEKLKDLGVIFASTKGCIEDFIWDPTLEELCLDPLTPILKGFIAEAKLEPKKSLCVSNACASSHSAIFLAQQWLEKKLVQYVIIIAADFLGPFVVNGFQSLRALSLTKNQPFAKDRDGLQLGEAAAVLLLGSNPVGQWTLKNVHLFNEGHALTRPKSDGEGLKEIYKSFLSQNSPPDLVIAHGTGTIHNDVAEDNAIASTFKDFETSPPITNTKWSIGHTLGASGAMDLIAACESIRTQKGFEIANTLEIDPQFKGKYLYKNSQHSSPKKISAIYVNSLGFGGITGALEITDGA